MSIYKQLAQQPLPLFCIESLSLCWMHLMDFSVAKISVHGALDCDIGLVGTPFTTDVIVKKR